jgi:hypothetical protein
MKIQKSRRKMFNEEVFCQGKVPIKHESAAGKAGSGEPQW